MKGPPADAEPAQRTKATKETRSARTRRQGSRWLRWPRVRLTPRRAAETAPGEAGRVPVPRPERRRSVRRQGEIAAAAGALLLPGGLERHTARDPPDGRPGGGDRDDRHADRGRGAPPRA